MTMVQVLENIGAGEGNRTLVISLEGCDALKAWLPEGDPARAGKASRASSIKPNINVLRCGCQMPKIQNLGPLRTGQNVLAVAGTIASRRRRTAMDYEQAEGAHSF